MALNPSFSIDYIGALTTSTELTPQLLAEILADLEPVALTTPITPETAEILSTYYSAFIFSLLLTDDVNEARFLFKRISMHLTPSLTDQPPTPVSELTIYPLILPTFNLLRAVYTRSYSSIYHIILTTHWTPQLQPVATAFLEHFRCKTFKLLSYAYTTITPFQAAIYLGFENESEQLLLQKLIAEGWLWDGDQGLLKTVTKGDGEEDLGRLVSVQGDTRSGKDGRIERLTGLITHLTDV